MPPSKHAVLSASGAHRWLHCNPSARLELEFADRETEAAAEGTAAHALAEHKLKKALKIRSRKPVSPYDCDEMDAHTDGYVEFVLEQLEEAKTLCADPLVLIEQRLDFSCYVPDGFGTGDCLIVADKLLHIIDFKYGQGILAIRPPLRHHPGCHEHLSAPPGECVHLDYHRGAAHGLGGTHPQAQGGNGLSR